MVRTLCHVSDLHFGSDFSRRSAWALREAILRTEVDHVVVTGDVTNRGKREELAEFNQTFAPLLEERRLIVVPGNHDCLGDGVAAALMDGPRVQVVERDDLYVVRVDSTGPHNRFLLAGHGMITASDLDAIATALDDAPRGSLRVVILHHHPLPLPEETLSERFSTWMGWPNAAEVAGGRNLLARLRGRCDLVLHGHRHVPSAATLFASQGTPLRVYNAGSTTSLGAMRIFAHRQGRLLGGAQWMATSRPSERARGEALVETTYGACAELL